MKTRLASLALLLALWAAPAFGQGCAMCYSSAAAASKDSQKSLNRAILVLLIPPLGFMTAGVGWAYRYGKKRDNEVSLSSEAADELDSNL
jgi:hypothetical protein